MVACTFNGFNCVFEGRSIFCESPAMESLLLIAAKEAELNDLVLDSPLEGELPSEEQVLFHQVKTLLGKGVLIEITNQDPDKRISEAIDD